MEVLELLYKKHRDWRDIVESFGVNPDTAEDLVMEMYIRIAKYVKSVSYTHLTLPTKRIV